MPAEVSIIVGTEQTTDLRLLAQGAKKVARHQLQSGGLGRARSNSASSCSDEHGFDAALRGDLRTAGKQVGGALHDRIRELLLEFSRLRRLRDVELLRVGDRQWTQHNRVDERKDRAARADADRQGQHNDYGEAGIPGEQAEGMPHVPPEIVEQSAVATRSDLLLRLFDAAEMKHGQAVCFGWCRAVLNL